MNPLLEDKIKQSYKILKLSALISKDYYKKPLVITYSGGKDSDVMLQLAIESLNSNDFEVVNSHTTVDAPETVYYIRDKFIDLNSIGVKTNIIYPHDKNGNFISMWSLIAKKKIPPTRINRYCCAELKELTIPNRFIALGVRESESINRRGRDFFSNKPKNKKDFVYYSLDHISEVYAQDKAWRIKNNALPNEESVFDCTFIKKAKNNDNLICSPIYKWFDSEIWDYIHERKIKYNPLYDKGFLRVGCIGCPLSSRQKFELEKYPKFKQNYINAFQKIIDNRTDNKNNSNKNSWLSGEDIYNWWINDDTIKGQFTINDYLENRKEVNNE